jgi:putative transposase
MNLSEIGLIAQQYWSDIPIHFKHVLLDDFVIMPNHIHGIIILDYSSVGPRHGVGLQSSSKGSVGPCHGMAPDNQIQRSFQNISQFSRPIKNSVSTIINQYKSSVKRWCNQNNFEAFNWQPRFYDHILLNDESIQNVKKYIRQNPANWNFDDLNI